MFECEGCDTLDCVVNCTLVFLFSCSVDLLAQWLVAHQIVRDAPICSVCDAEVECRSSGRFTKVRRRRKVTCEFALRPSRSDERECPVYDDHIPVWRCPECTTKHSFIGSAGFLEFTSRIGLRRTVIYLYMLARQYPVKNIQQELSLSSVSMCNLNSLTCELCSLFLTEKFWPAEARVRPYGGEYVIQADETPLRSVRYGIPRGTRARLNFKKKMNKVGHRSIIQTNTTFIGRCRRYPRNLQGRKLTRAITMWCSGFVETTCKVNQSTPTKFGVSRCVLSVWRPLHTRKKEYIQAQLREMVSPGSTIWSDSLRSYNSLSDTYIHESVNHSQTFKSPTGVCTNSIEGSWNNVKRIYRKIFTRLPRDWKLTYDRVHFACFLYNCSIRNCDPFVALLRAAKVVYPPYPTEMQLSDSSMVKVLE